MMAPCDRTRLLLAYADAVVKIVEAVQAGDGMDSTKRDTVSANVKHLKPLLLELED